MATIMFFSLNSFGEIKSLISPAVLGFKCEHTVKNHGCGASKGLFAGNTKSPFEILRGAWLTLVRELKG